MNCRSLFLAAAATGLTAFGVLAQRPGPPPGGGAPAAKLPPNSVTITIEGDTRIIHSNGIPDHSTGAFPNPHNPNALAAQDHTFRVTTKPQPAPQLRPSRGAFFGVALNGVPFEAGTAEFWNNDPRWNYEAMTGKLDLGIDENHAHVQPGGVYHYHGLPTGLINSRAGTGGKMLLLGYAADGFPIYTPWDHTDPKDATSPLRKMRSSWRLKEGMRPGNPNGPGGKYDGAFTADFEYAAGGGDLDEANGRTGATPEYPEGIYHYLITEDFPYLPRSWRGTPDESFFKRGPRGGGPMGPRPPDGQRPPPPWFDGPPRGPRAGPPN